LKITGTPSFLFSLLLIWSQSVQGQVPLPQLERNQLDRTSPLREVRNSSQLSGVITERQAVNLARQRFAGNILRITLVGESSKQRYQIRMENSGKVFTVFVHARNGEVTGGN